MMDFGIGTALAVVAVVSVDGRGAVNNGLVSATFCSGASDCIAFGCSGIGVRWELVTSVLDVARLLPLVVLVVVMIVGC